MGNSYKKIIITIFIIVAIITLVSMVVVMSILYGDTNGFFKFSNDNYSSEQVVNETTKKIAIYLDDTKNTYESENDKETNDDTYIIGSDIVTSETNESETSEEMELEATEYTKKSDEDKYKPAYNFRRILNREKKDVLCFMGDVFLSRKPRDAYDEKGLEGIIDESYLKILENSDFNIANLECSITDNMENAADKTFTFALPSKYTSVFSEIGIDLFTLANNHILDYGVDAMLDTIKVLDNNNILHIGAGKNIDEAKTAYIKEIDGKRYAFLAASSVLPKDDWKADYSRAGVFNGYDLTELCAEIKSVKNYVDKVIVYMHWGRELETASNNWQRIHAKRIVDAGADLVIGSHPHMVQEIEFYKNVPIIYSLGNFIYGGTMRDTILLTATFDYSIDKKGTLQLQIFPGVSSYERVKRDWNKDDISKKIKELQDKSSTCFIGENGVIFTMEQVIEALKSRVDVKSITPLES